MPASTCPSCKCESARELTRMSNDPTVTYFRCDDCGHVWVTFSDGRTLHHVTPPGEDTD